MQRTINVMVIVIETGGEALAHTLAIIAVTPTAREARDQRGAQQPLCVDDSFMRLFPHRPSESADLTPCLRLYKYIVFDWLERSSGRVYDEPCHRTMGHDVALPNTDWVARNHSCVPLYYRPHPPQV